MPTRDHVYAVVREFQCSLPEQGVLYEPIYQFIDRTLEEFWSVELERKWIVRPVVRFDPLLEAYGGWESMNPLSIPEGVVLSIHPSVRINRLLETMAHELVHVYESCIGEPTRDNVHRQTFHDEMFDRYGIKTRGIDGSHYGNDGRWDEWVAQNEDLGFGRIVLE